VSRPGSIRPRSAYPRDVGLLKHVLQGFGWRVGSEVAREAVDRAADQAYDRVDDARQRVEEAREAHRRQKEEKRRRAAEAREAERREAAIEDELEALRKRVDRDR